MKNNTVSIIMPVYNSESTVCASVHSILDQTHTDWELILVDDCSSDNSVSSLLNIISGDSRVRVYRTEKNSGPAYARNLGIGHAQGRYIAFCDSDDIWFPDKLNLQLQAIQQRGAAICCTGYKPFITDLASNYVISPPENITYSDLLRYNYIGCSTVIVDRFKVVGISFPDIRRAEDYALWLNIGRLGHKIVGIKSPLVFYRIGSSSESANKSKAARGHLNALLVQPNLGWFWISYYYIAYVIIALYRKFNLSKALNLGVVR